MVESAAENELHTLLRSPLFSDLDPQACKAIVDAATTYAVQRGEYFFHQGEAATAFFMVKRGRVRLSQIADDGHQVIFHYFGPGDAIGIAVALAGAVYPVSAEAISGAAALGWERQVAINLMEQYPRLAINGMQLLAGRFWELQNRYRELATENVEQRLARAIIRLMIQNGDRLENSSNTVLKISRQELAEMTGTTLFTVSRICSDWESRGIVLTGRKKISVRQRDQLEAIANALA